MQIDDICNQKQPVYTVANQHSNLENSTPLKLKITFTAPIRKNAGEVFKEALKFKHNVILCNKEILN